MNAKAFALASGVWLGFLLFLATLVEAARGEGHNLILLSVFFIGYSVSYLGSLVALVYGFAGGALVGAAFAWLYNRFAGGVGLSHYASVRAGGAGGYRAPARVRAVKLGATSQDRLARARPQRSKLKYTCTAAQRGNQTHDHRRAHRTPYRTPRGPHPIHRIHAQRLAGTLASRRSGPATGYRKHPRTRPRRRNPRKATVRSGNLKRRLQPPETHA